MKKTFLASLLSFFVFFCSHSQTNLKGTPIVTSFSKKDYRAGAEVRKIIRFKDVVYFATDEGLLVLRNGKWKTICPQLSVHSVEIDSINERVYIGSEGEFGYKKLCPDCDDYISLSNKLDEGDKNFDEVLDISKNRLGIFFITAHKVFILKGEVPKQVPTDSLDNRRLITIATIDTLLYIVRENGIYDYFNHEVNDFGYFSSLHIITTLPYTKDTILVATQKTGMHYFPIPINYNNLLVNVTWKNVDAFLYENYISCAIRLSDGNYAIGTDIKGILIIDKYGNPLYHINSGNGLLSNGVKTIYQDQSGDLWVGLENGISYVELNSPFKKIYTSSNIQGKAYSSFISNDTLLYLLTSKGVFYRNLNKSQSPLNPIDFDLIPGTEGAAFSIVQIGDSLLLGHQMGIFLIKNNRIVRTINYSQDNWVLIKVPNSPYVISGTSSGLYRYDTRKLLSSDIDISKIYIKIDTFDKPCRNIVIDSHHNIWVSDLVEGVYKIQLNADMTKTLGKPVKYGVRDGLPPGKVKIFQGANNNLYFATSNGIYSYEENNNSKPFKINTFFNDTPVKGARVQIFKMASSSIYWFASTDRCGYFILDIPSPRFEEFNPIAEIIVFDSESILPFGKDNANAIIGTSEGFFLFNYATPYSSNRNRKMIMLGKMIGVPESNPFPWEVTSMVFACILLLFLLLFLRWRRSGQKELILKSMKIKEQNKILDISNRENSQLSFEKEKLKDKNEELSNSLIFQEFLVGRFEKVINDLKKRVEDVMHWSGKKTNLNPNDILEKVKEWEGFLKNQPAAKVISEEIDNKFIKDIQIQCPDINLSEAVICYLYHKGKSGKYIGMIVGYEEGTVNNYTSLRIPSKLSSLLQEGEKLKDYLNRFRNV